MVKELLKVIGIAALVLLLGQIPVGRSTIAAHFQRKILDALSWSGHAVPGTFVATNRVKRPAEIDDDSSEGDLGADDGDGASPDEVSPADRESIMRLLQ